jgi:hypothetical protein
MGAAQRQGRYLLLRATEVAKVMKAVATFPASPRSLQPWHKIDTAGLGSAETNADIRWVAMDATLSYKA